METVFSVYTKTNRPDCYQMIVQQLLRVEKRKNLAYLNLNVDDVNSSSRLRSIRSIVKSFRDFKRFSHHRCNINSPPCVICGRNLFGAQRNGGLGLQQNPSRRHHRSHCNTNKPAVDVPVMWSHVSTELVSSQEDWEIEAILDR